MVAPLDRGATWLTSPRIMNSLSSRVAKGHVDITHMLIESGTDLTVGRQSNTGYPCRQLHHDEPCVHHNNIMMQKLFILFLKQGTGDVNAGNKNILTAFVISLRSGLAEIIHS